VVLAQATPEIRAMLDPSGSGRDIAAVYRTFARHPKLYVPRQVLSEYIRTKSTLSPRVREMLILRIGWRCRSAYEWAAHAPAGRRAGLTDEQIRMLARTGYEGWNAADTAIVRAVDELHTYHTISDATWTALDEQFDEKQLLDVLITTGGYRMVSMVLNSFGVPAEPNSEALPQ
jgi:alkylhydroperoxidase family enzyme